MNASAPASQLVYGRTSWSAWARRYLPSSPCTDLTRDPARVAAKIVTGIGFLGAGAILHQRSNVHGLTTAASLWVTAAMRLAVGVGMTLTPAPDAGVGVSLATAILLFLLLRFGPQLGHRIGERDSE